MSAMYCSTPLQVCHKRLNKQASTTRDKTSGVPLTLLPPSYLQNKATYTCELILTVNDPARFSKPLRISLKLNEQDAPLCFV